MKYKINKPTSDKFTIDSVLIKEIAPKVLFIHVDTDDCKWPDVMYGSEGDREEIIFMEPLPDDCDDIPNVCSVTLIPEKDWEKNIMLAKHSGRYGWGGFGIATELLEDI